MYTFNRRIAKANVNPIRQRTQFSCVAASTAMALNSLGVKCNEDEVNEVIGARPMTGASWESVLACVQHYGCRGTLVTPSTVKQVKEWTDAGKPVLIGWNPEGREWSHASLVFDVVEREGGGLDVYVADSNIPDPEETVRIIDAKEFYSKWYEKYNGYLIRRSALMVDNEISPEGRQIMASLRKRRF